jgi:hypothetical protein
MKKIMFQTRRLYFLIGGEYKSLSIDVEKYLPGRSGNLPVIFIFMSILEMGDYFRERCVFSLTAFRRKSTIKYALF